jgi:hypothetical protein
VELDYHNNIVIIIIIIGNNTKIQHFVGFVPLVQAQVDGCTKGAQTKQQQAMIRIKVSLPNKLCAQGQDPLSYDFKEKDSNARFAHPSLPRDMGIKISPFHPKLFIMMLVAVH